MWCVYIYIYIYIYVHGNECMHVCMPTCAYMQMCMSVYVYMHLNMRICTYLCKCMCMYMYMYIRNICVDEYIHIYLCIIIYAYYSYEKTSVYFYIWIQIYIAHAVFIHSVSRTFAVRSSSKSKGRCWPGQGAKCARDHTSEAQMGQIPSLTLVIIIYIYIHTVYLKPLNPEPFIVNEVARVGAKETLS